MSTKEIPQLDTNLNEGHSHECLALDVDFYPDLEKLVSDTHEKLMSLVYDFLDQIDLAERIDRNLGYVRHQLKYSEGKGSFEGLLREAQELQRIIRRSSLTEDEKSKIWTPIAECYAQIQSALKERITPLEQRTLLEVGQTFWLPVEVTNNTINGRMILHCSLPRFGYAITRYRDNGSKYREPINNLFFDDNCTGGLSFETTKTLRTLAPRLELPLRIVSASCGMITKVEIDEAALSQRTEEAQTQEA